jgi:hypothetical protein
MLILGHFYGISPLVSELSIFITGVGVVENGEFWSWNSGKMFNLNITNVKGNEELVMPDECSEPFVVFPSSESRNSIN